MMMMSRIVVEREMGTRGMGMVQRMRMRREMMQREGRGDWVDSWAWVGRWFGLLLGLYWERRNSLGEGLGCESREY
jgi:hypothetical protein